MPPVKTAGALQAALWFLKSHHLFLLALIALVSSLYLFGVRPTRAVSACHAVGQQLARGRLAQRIQADPENKQFVNAFNTGLFLQDDYQTAYRNCMRERGYDVAP